MSHFPKPFFRKPRKRWYVQIDGDQINLGPDKDAAFVEYRRIMAERDSAPAAPATRPADGLTVAEVYDKFLSWCKQHREGLTYKGYGEFIQGFIDHLGGERCLMPAGDLRPFHVVEWVDSHENWGPTRRRNAMVHVQRPYNWAFKLGYVKDNPIRHLEKPKASRRDNHITPEDYALLLSKIKAGDPFRDLIVFSWESGSRPQEARHIEPKHVNLSAARIEIPPAEAKGRKRWRAILLNDAALAVVRRRLEVGGEKLFLNTDGAPWKNQAIVCRFQRLKKKLGKAFAAYDIRHGFAQKLLESGADHLSVAELMGHVNGTMLATVYSHMSKADGHLRDTLKKADGGS